MALSDDETRYKEQGMAFKRRAEIPQETLSNEMLRGLIGTVTQLQRALDEKPATEHRPMIAAEIFCALMNSPVGQNATNERMIKLAVEYADKLISELEHSRLRR